MVGLASKAQVKQNTGTQAGIGRTLALLGGGIGGAGIGGGIGGAAGAGGAGGFLSSIGKAGGTAEGAFGLQMKGFFSNIGKQMMAQKNEQINFFKNIRGDDGQFDTKSFLDKVTKQFGRGVQR